MAALAFVAAGVAIVLAVVFWRRRYRQVQVQVQATVRQRDEAIADRDAATLAGERMRRAVDSLDLGVLVFDGRGSVVYRNDAASEYTTGRRTEAMAIATIEELTGGALAGRSDRRTLEQYGPPHRTVVL